MIRVSASRRSEVFVRRPFAAFPSAALLAAFTAVSAFAAGPAQPAASAHATRPAATRPAAPRPAPKLVVLLVVDQMRADYVDKFSAHWTGGLRRLIDEGAWYRDAAYPYTATVTCVGHSSISTGSLPRTHGIIGDSWLNRETGKVAVCVADPDTKLVSYGRPVDGTSVSGKAMRTSTLADELRAQSAVPPRVVTLSMKDYAATAMAGHGADAVVWMNASAGTLMTSSAFSPRPVPWVADFLKAHPIEQDFGKAWTRLLPDADYLYADDARGERTPTGSGWTRTFPHPLKGAGTKPDDVFYGEWEESPFSDAYLGKLAEASIDALKLGQGRGTDYLAVSFSALDFVGHDFGPRSHEVQDVLARLDRTLGSLIARLDARVGRGRYVLALTGDHGVSPIPEQLSALGLAAGRIVAPDVVARVNAALTPWFGPGDKAVRMVYEDLFFAPGVYDKLRANPEAMRAALEAVAATPGVARVFTADQLQSSPPAAGDTLEREAAASFFPGRSGEFIVLPRPYFQSVPNASRTTGTTHGSPYWYDRHVPLFLLGDGIRKGQYLAPASPLDLAPTLAYLCGITLPAPDGRLLGAALGTRN